MTEGLLAFSSALAMAGTMVGGNASREAVNEQNFIKLRRLTPWRYN
jgi:hypothetical protein